MRIVPVTKLRNDNVESQARYVNWSEVVWGEENQFWEADECYQCSKVVVGGTELGCQCPHCEADNEGFDGPIYNTFYPLGMSAWGNSRMELAPEDVAKNIVHLPLCVVYYRDEYGLALTGAGMDLTKEICLAYMLAGYLPPVHFARDIPHMAGTRLDDAHRWLFAGCNRSLRMAIRWNQMGLKDIANYRKELRKRKEKA